MARDRREERWRRLQDRLDRAEPPKRGRGPRGKGSVFATAAERFGLELLREDARTARLGGALSGLEVEVLAESSSEGLRWSATIEAPEIPRGFGLGPDVPRGSLKKRLLGEDLLTGDAGFDAQVAISGDPMDALALLDGGARARVLRLMAAGLELSRGRLRLRWTTPLGAPPAPASALELRTAVGLVGRWGRARRARLERLRENARRDPSAGARLRNAALLAEASPALWAESRLDVADLLARASPALGAEPNLSGSALALLATLEDPSPALLRLAPEALVLMFEAASGPLQVALAHALGARGGVEALPVLLSQASGLLVRRELKDAARRAVVAIEARLGAERGQLSVVASSDARGALSEVEEEGALSFTEPDSR